MSVSPIHDGNILCSAFVSKGKKDGIFFFFFLNTAAGCLAISGDSNVNKSKTH